MPLDLVPVGDRIAQAVRPIVKLKAGRSTVHGGLQDKTMAASVDESGFRRAHEAVLDRRRARERAREEVPVVERALRRALQDSTVIYESLNLLTATAAHLAMQSEAAARPLPEDPAARLLESLRRGSERQPIRDLRRQAAVRDHFHAEADRVRPALEACFGAQALLHLGHIGRFYNLAWEKLNRSETRILRRLGGSVPSVSPQHGQVIAHAPLSQEDVYGPDVILLLDPFFRIETTSRYQLITHAGRAQDLELLQAATLVHEALHWLPLHGHQGNGDLRNPQNYEFYLSQRHARQPMSYSALNTLRRP
jgi:hypothetical protein